MEISLSLSLTKPFQSVESGPPPEADERISEDGDTRISEAGDIRVTES